MQHLTLVAGLYMYKYEKHSEYECTQAFKVKAHVIAVKFDF